MTRALPLVLATLIAGAPLAPGGQQSDEMISRRLVALLFPGMIDSIVEGLAEEVPETLLPDGATPLVSSTSSRGVTVVAELPSFAAADRPRYERKLAAAGWKEGEGPLGGGGLMSSPVPVPTMYCQGDEALSFSSQPKPGGGVVFRLSVMQGVMYGPCGGRDARGPRSAFDEIEVPALPPPPGSRSSGTSGSSGGDASAQTTRLQTKLSASEVEAHYTSLLTSHGWTMSSRAAADGVSMARFAVTPDTGTDKSPRLATLEALSLPDGNVLVTLRVIGPRRGW